MGPKEGRYFLDQFEVAIKQILKVEKATSYCLQLNLLFKIAIFLHIETTEQVT